MLKGRVFLGRLLHANVPSLFVIVNGGLWIFHGDVYSVSSFIFLQSLQFLISKLFNIILGAVMGH